jgi:ferrous iron transport protein B
MTPALVGTIYIPCLSTIAVLAKEFGWKAASLITVANLAVAVLAGGFAFRILTLVL